MTICHKDEFVQSHFLDGNLIVWYIDKMGTNGGGGVVEAWRCDDGGGGVAL